MGQLSESHALGGGLKSRHVTMLSIAGVIGASLFVDAPRDKCGPSAR